MFGTIVSIQDGRGFGFIKPDSANFGSNISFHFRALQDLEFGPDLKGQRVEFDVDHSGEKGPRATNIRSAE